MKKIIIAGLVMIFLSLQVEAQNVGNLKKDIKNKFKHPVKLTGSLSTNHVYYNAFAGEPRLQPYGFYVMGRLNLDILSVKLPFTFRYSNQQYTFKKPQFQTFNNFGVAPYYKWVKLYLGYNTIHFSNLVLASPFTGAGIELTPGKFRFAALYGRFAKAILPDSTNNTQPVYKRTGYAMIMRYGGSSDFISLSTFKAVDDSASLDYIYALGNNVKPQENFVYNIQAGKKIFSKLFLSAEFANSFVTEDITNQELTEVKKSVQNFGYYFLTPRVSTGSYYAYRGKAVYTIKKHSIGVNFEHIDAGYQTLGAPYFNSDIERISMLYSSQLMKEKLKFDVNIGKERNNLDGYSIASAKRLNYSFNVNFMPTQRINMTLNYSNFTSVARMQSNFEQINSGYFENLDTLNYTQVAQNANFNGFFMLSDPKNTKKQQNLMLNLNYQQANSNQGETNNITENSNMNLTYMHSLLPISLTLAGSLNLNYAKYTESQNITYGPTIAVTKGFFKRKLNNTFSASWNQTTSDANVVSQYFNTRYTLTYRFHKKHTFRLSLMLINREMNSDKTTEFTGTFNYSFRF